MMNVPVIGFIPPHIGMEADFNTFRLGLKLSKQLTLGAKVFLMCQKTMTVFGVAEVLGISTGSLTTMLLDHALKNHSELHLQDTQNSPKRLFELMQKIYGPHIATENKKTTVVHLRRNDKYGPAQHDALWKKQWQDHRIYI